MAGVHDMILRRVALQQKMLAVLIDPDIAVNEQLLTKTVQNACIAGADLILVGGSLLTTDRFDACMEIVTSLSDRPVVLFPGEPGQISPRADALLFLTLISGRNPEYLIGHQVNAAPKLLNMGLETISTGYMLVDGGKVTTAHYVSRTEPIPHDHNEIAMATAQAGQLLGNKLIYMDTGSGAPMHVSCSMLNAVRRSVNIPLIVGGGLRSTTDIHNVCKAGADVVVVGTAFEEDPELIYRLCEATHTIKISS